MFCDSGEQQEFTIRDLMDEFHVTARALRFYEAKGLLSPMRRGRARAYSAEDRARLAIVLRGRRIGFSLDEIREMLDFQQVRRRGRAALRVTRDRLKERAEQLEKQRIDIDHALMDLSAGIAWLEARIADEEPSKDLKTSAAAFEALARSWLWGEQSAGGSNTP